MSHVTSIEMKVRDLDCLREAVEACGGEFRQDKRTYAWWGHRAGGGDYGGLPPSEDGKCLHAIGERGVTPRMGAAGPWEIGVRAARDGDGYMLLYDYFGSAGERLHETFGRGLSKLKQEYAVAVATKKAAHLARQGYALRRENVGARVRLSWVKR